MPAGYSKNPLIKKLGIKEGQRLIIINPPVNYGTTLGKLPDEVTIKKSLSGQFDFIHFFTKQRSDLESKFIRLKQALDVNGMLWISWPKKASKVETDITEDVVRGIALANGLVDVKVCAVDEVWSGLKLVYRVKDRKSKVK